MCGEQTHAVRIKRSSPRCKMHADARSVAQPTCSQMIPGRSRWLVGSSSSSRSGWRNRAWASETRMRQPPAGAGLVGRLSPQNPTRFHAAAAAGRAAGTVPRGRANVLPPTCTQDSAATLRLLAARCVDGAQAHCLL